MLVRENHFGKFVIGVSDENIMFNGVDNRSSTSTRFSLKKSSRGKDWDGL